MRARQTLADGWVLDIDLDAFMPPSFTHRAPPWAHGGALGCCSPHLYKTACHRWSSPTENCARSSLDARQSNADGCCANACAGSLWRHLGHLLHDKEIPAEAGDSRTGLGEECLRQARAVAGRWRALAAERPGLRAAGARLAPAELLLWLQAHELPPPERIHEAQMQPHFPRFVRRLEAMLEAVAAAGAGPPAAITVARSPDGFAPLEILPSVEATILEMLERVYGGAGRELAVRHTRETAALHDLVEVVDWLPKR